MTAAAAMGGYLATPELPNESYFVYNNLVAPAANGIFQGYWLGTFSLGAATAYQWEWVTGGTVTSWAGAKTHIDWAYTNGESQGLLQWPNNTWTATYALQDAPRSYLANGFVVEYTANPASTSVPEPATIALLAFGFLGFEVSRRKMHQLG